MNGNKIAFWLLGILSTISLSVAGFALVWQFNANAEIKVMQEQLKKKSQSVAIHTKLDRTDGRHWKLHQWAKDKINDLRRRHDLESESWPDLGD